MLYKSIKSAQNDTQRAMYQQETIWPNKINVGYTLEISKYSRGSLEYRISNSFSGMRGTLHVEYDYNVCYSRTSFNVSLYITASGKFSYAQISKYSRGEVQSSEGEPTSIVSYSHFKSPFTGNEKVEAISFSVSRAKDFDDDEIDRINLRVYFVPYE